MYSPIRKKKYGAESDFWGTFCWFYRYSCGHHALDAHIGVGHSSPVFPLWSRISVIHVFLQLAQDMTFCCLTSRALPVLKQTSRDENSIFISSPCEASCVVRDAGALKCLCLHMSIGKIDSLPVADLNTVLSCLKLFPLIYSFLDTYKFVTAQPKNMNLLFLQFLDRFKQHRW